MASEEQSNIPVTLQLVKYKPVPWLFRNDLPEPPVKTPSEWFSKRWPEQAETFGTPFLEAKLHDGDLEQHVNTIAGLQEWVWRVREQGLCFSTLAMSLRGLMPRRRFIDVTQVMPGCTTL